MKTWVRLLPRTSRRTSLAGGFAEKARQQNSSSFRMFLLKNVSLFSVCAHAEDGIHLLRLSGNVIPSSGTACLALYCLWTVARWTAPELMSLAKGGSENMHTCCSRSNKTPAADTGGWFVTAQRIFDYIWKLFSICTLIGTNSPFFKRAFQQFYAWRSVYPSAFSFWKCLLRLCREFSTFWEMSQWCQG